MAENRKSWGAGRVAFIARLDKIKGELAQGLPLTTIYANHQAALGIGYPSFCKLVNRYAPDAKLATRRSRAPTTAELKPPQAAPIPKPARAEPPGDVVEDEQDDRPAPRFGPGRLK